MRALEESLSKELQSVLTRIQKADAQPSSSTEVSFDDGSLPLHGRTDFKRRWTCAADGADSISSIIRRTASVDGAEDTGRGDESQAHSSTVPTPKSAATGTSPSSNPRKTISFNDRLPSDEGADDSDSPRRSDDEGSEDAVKAKPSHDRERDPDETSMRSGSSVVWRIDALDCGDRLASSAAAKKGSATVDSIVELVESERRRWAEEKLALEARLEELKEQRQAHRRMPDAEKAELKRKVQELRETMKQRSRFGAWVCERHMQESDDEEESDGHLEKEELRETIMMLRAELRRARPPQQAALQPAETA